MLRLAHSRLRDSHSSEDVVQDVLLNIANRNPQLEDLTKIRSWLYQAVVRRVADHFRSLYRRERVVHELSQSIEEHQEEEGLDRIATIETHEILRDAIGRLAGQDREIIVLKFTHNWSYKRIGERFSIPERAVEYRLVCAKRQLRKELQNLTGANDE